MSERSTHVQVTAPGETEPPQEFALLWFERFLGGSRILVDKMSAEASDGKYVAEGLEPGKYLVCAVSPDYAPSAFQAVELDGNETKSVSLRLRTKGFLRGRILDLDDVPVDGAVVSLADMGDVVSTESVADGSFMLEVPSGDVSLLVAHGSFSGTTLDVRVGAGAAVSLEDIVLDRGSSLEGELIGSDDKPAPGVDVVLQGAQGFWRTTTTDENGTFSFTGLHPGKYVLGTGLFPHERMARTVRISSNEVKSIILQPYAGTSMHGTVSAGGKPVSCTVTAFGMARGEGLVSIRSALSDEEGEFTLHGLSSDSGRVNVLMFALPLEPGTTSVLERLHIPKGSGEVERTFSLPTGKVRASVRDLSDSAIVGVTLTVSQIGVLRREDATELARILGGVNTSSAETGADGKVEVRYLSPGKYQVSVMKKGYRPSHHQVTVKQDEEVDLGVMGLQRIASQPGTVVGRVKGASGRPLRALLILSDSDGIPIDKTYSGLDGRFSFGGLEPGKYSVAGEGETPGFTTLGDIQVSEGRATQVEVSLRHD